MNEILKWCILLICTSGCNNLHSGENYIVEVFVFNGNTYSPEKLEEVNFTFSETYQNGQLVKKYYPRYSGIQERTITTVYDTINRKTIEIEMMKSSLGQQSLDSTLYKYEDNNDTYIYKKRKGREILIREIYKQSDTTIITEYAGRNSFEIEEIYDSLNFVKSTEVIDYDDNEIINYFYYNDKGEEIKHVRSENGLKEVVSETNYKYDEDGRMIFKQLVFPKENMIAWTEIRKYKK